MPIRLSYVFAALAVTWLSVPQAHACGGMVQTARGTVSQSGQLAILSVHDGVTDVTLTLDVPEAANDFGVLVPVPSEPRIDAMPVSTEALRALEENTRPVYITRRGGSSDDSGCGGASASKSSIGPNRGVVAAEPVQIGDVSAVWLQGSSGTAVASWLAERNFTLPPGGDAVLEQYVLEGMSFLAFTRSQASATPKRVGVRFTLDGDVRAYALRMTRLGARDAMTFTLFVATESEQPIGPDAPYTGLSVEALDGDDYASALRAAVAAEHGKAFVVESHGAAASLPKLASTLFAPNAHVTRLSTITEPANLDYDVTFTHESKVPVDSFEALYAVSQGHPRNGTDPRVASGLLVLGSVLLRRRKILR